MTELFARYGRLYAALAPLSIALSFLPPFTFVMRGDQAVFFGTVWDMASTPAGDPARAAMILLTVMFGCLLAAAAADRAGAARHQRVCSRDGRRPAVDQTGHR